MKDREVTSTRCPLCHNPAKRKIRWFMNNSKVYYSVSLCQEHGYVSGKIRIRRTEDNMYYVIKMLTNITSEEKGFIIALYCNCVNNSFNLSLSSWKFWESKIKVSKSTFYKLKKSLVSRGYLRRLEYVPENPDSGNHPEDYMLCVPWLGDISYIDWLHQYKNDDITIRNIFLSNYRVAPVY